MNLEVLGFNKWFEDRIDPERSVNSRIARVIAVDRDSYVVNDAEKDVIAEITGKFIFKAESSLDYPAVGDWVYAQYFDNDSFAVIHDIMPRKSTLKRKTSGKKIAFQLIAANIDTAFIVQSLDFNFNPRRLERYLVMINNADIQPVVLLSKSDLLSASEIEEKTAEIRNLTADNRIPVTAFSNETRLGLEDVNACLLPGKTFCLLGSSGVGKTTLLNNLLAKAEFETRSVRKKDGKGRHTTTRRQLIHLPNGAMIIDTPGMRELGNFDVDTGLAGTFDEISALVGQCRYNDCGHTHPEGCAVLAALDAGTISSERYENYIKMNKESAFYAMSYLEKKQKDKQFGKMVKSVMKHKHRNGRAR